MARGIDEFYKVLKDYRKLLVWAAGISALPFAAAFSSLAPPWPPHIAPITAVAQLAVLIVAFQLLQVSEKRVVDRVVVASFVALFALSLSYLAILLAFTFELPGETGRVTRGFYCTHIAQTQFPDKCPLLGRDEMNEANNIPTRLWTSGSITAVHISLIASWTASFMALASLVGCFAVFQQRGTRPRARSSTRSAPPSIQARENNDKN